MRMTIGVFVLVAATAFASDTSNKDSYVFRDGGITWMIGQGMSPEALQRIQSQYGNSFLWARRNGQIFVTRERFVLDSASIIVARPDSGLQRQARFAEITDAAMRRTAKRRGSYVLTTAINRALISGGMTIENVVNIRNKYDKQFLWVRTSDGTWLIEDPEYLQRATAFFAEERALGPEQRAVSEEESQLDREEERLEDRHDAASKTRLREIRSRQREVSRREEELDDRQEALEKIAEDKLWALIDDAIRRGVARPVR
jgi:hypothetical protein